MATGLGPGAGMNELVDATTDPPGFEVPTAGFSEAPLSLSTGNGSVTKGVFLTLAVFVLYSVGVAWVVGVERISEPGSLAGRGLHSLVHVFFDRDAYQLWWVIPMMLLFGVAQQVRTLGGVILAGLGLYIFKSGAIDLHTML